MPIKLPHCLRPVFAPFFAMTFLVMAAYPHVAWSHNDQHHDAGISTADHTDSLDSLTTFPLQVGDGRFKLIDHHGKQVTNESYEGRHLLVFFGYISCKSMCSISLARIGEALTLLGDSVNKLAPLVITVDPERDTPEAMRAALYKFHPNLIGLTGKPDRLKEVYQNYKHEPTAMGNDDHNDPIISHTSYIYLINKNGKFATLFPPILNPQSMANIIRKYIDDAST